MNYKTEQREVSAERDTSQEKRCSLPVLQQNSRVVVHSSYHRRVLEQLLWVEDEEEVIAPRKSKLSDGLPSGVKSLIVALLLLLGGVPQLAHSQYSQEAQKIKNLSEQYDQRGYMKGQTISVDGNLVVSNSTGVPSYSYPLSSFTSNGHAIGVTLNYAGSVSFTTFYKYFELSASNPTSESWAQYHQTRPAWLLGVNGFAVQALGFAGTLVNDPAYMKYVNNAYSSLVPGDFTDKHLVWLMDGYDYSNRMREMAVLNNNDHDVIRLLRSDGSVLELHNVLSYDDIPEGTAHNWFNGKLYVGDYYPLDMNPSGYGRVQYDSTYITAGVHTGDSLHLPGTMPRILRYYPGDGLEYVFREFCIPYGEEPYTAVLSNGATGDAAYGTNRAGATIFYLEEINDGSQEVLRFEHSRHKAEEQMLVLRDSTNKGESPTRGRALCTGFTGHEIVYGSNSIVVEALGRSTKIFFSGVGSGSAYVQRDSLSQSAHSAMFAQAERGADPMNTGASIPEASHASFLGFVTAIVDPEGRETRFEYEKYKRRFENIGFPHDLVGGQEKDVVLENWRLTRVVEPSIVQELSYYGSLDTTLVAGAGLLEPSTAQEKWALKTTLTPTVHEAKRYEREGLPLGNTLGLARGSLLHTQEFGVRYTSIPSTLDFPQQFYKDNWISSTHVTDAVTGHETWQEQHYHIYEFPTHERLQTVPFTQMYATESIADNEYTRTETHYKKLDTMMVQPVLSFSMARTGSSGPYLLKGAVRTQYDTTTVRQYPSQPSAQQYVGREIAEKRQYILDPSDTSTVLLVNETQYLHLPLYDTTMVLRQRTWNKFKARRAHQQLKEDNMSLGITSTPSWEEFLVCTPVYDTLELSQRRYFPPVYNLERRQVVKDASGDILQGIARRYALGYSQSNNNSVYRGALLTDTALGGDGNTYIANSYTYYGGLQGYGRELLATKTNANGAVERYLYEYPCNTNNRTGVVRRNDNTDSVAYLFERNGLKEYESPLGTELPVRKVVNGGGDYTETLRTLQERTYHDQVSATVDANGWYSKYAYDKNGRLQVAWLPRDFQGDSLYAQLHYGSKSVHMEGYTRHYRNMDTMVCNPASYTIGPLGWDPVWRFRAALPRTQYPCNGMVIASAGKREQVMVTANTPIPFENDIRELGYCTGVYSEAIEKAVSLDSARLVLNIAKVVGTCVSFRVSVLVPEGSFYSTTQAPQFDTLQTHVYVLNCAPVTGGNNGSALRAGGNAPSKRDGSVVLSGSSSPLYDELVMDLTNIRTDLLNEAWMVEIAVETPRAEVEVVNSAEDWGARLELVGTFREVDELADYTLKYDVLDKPGQSLSALMSAKVDDSVHTSSYVSMGAPQPNSSRFHTSEVRFGGDYRALSAKEDKRLGGPSGATWQDSVTTQYTGLGATTRTTDELGDTVRSEYDAQGRVVKQYHADGSVRRMHYASGTPSSLLASAPNTWYGYSSRVVTVEEDGIMRAQFYDAFGRLRLEAQSFDTVTNIAQRRTTYNYDLLGRLTEVVNPAGDTTRYWYDAFGRVSYKHQPDMGYTAYGYDHLGQVRFAQTEQQHNEGKVTFTEYDDLGRVTLVGEARLEENKGEGDPPKGSIGKREREREQVQTVYGGLKLKRLPEELVGTVLQDGGVSSSLTANRTVWLPPSSLPTIFEQQDITSTLCVPPGLNGIVRVPYMVHPVETHDEPELPLSPMNSFEDIAKYPENARMAVEYDNLPKTGGSVWRYFPSRTKWEQLMPHGKARNLKGREAAVAYRTHAGEPYHYVAMSYDERGRVEALVRYTEALGFEAVYYQYNSMNAVTQVRVADGLRQHVVWYGYNQSGKVDTVWSTTTTSGQGLGLGIGNAVQYVASPAKPANAEIVYAYTKRWQVANMTYPRIATEVAYAYNARRFVDSMVAQKSGQPLFRQVLSYDVTGQITRQESQHAGQAVQYQKYGYYNSSRQLRTWQRDTLYSQTTGEEYYYDDIGNRTIANYFETGKHSSYKYQSSGGPNQLSAVVQWLGQNPIDTTVYDYSASGAMKSRAQGGIDEELFYDNIQGLVKRYKNTNGSIVGEWRYRYSASGERELKREHETQGVVAPKRWQYYLLGLGGEQLAVYEGHEVEQPTCGYFASEFTPQLFISASEYLVYGLGSVHNITVRPVDPTKNWNEYAITDHLGSTRVVVDEGGAIAGQYDYAPFGGILWQSAQTQRRSWIDKEKDAENGLGDFGVRKYDDGIGRFTSIDPLWEKYRAWSPYNYSGNNPMTIKDPSGEVFDFSATSGDKGEQLKAAKLVDEAIDYLVKNGAAEEAQILIDLRDRKDIVVKMEVLPESRRPFDGQYQPGTQTLIWSPFSASRLSNGKTQSPALNLLHEGAHALRHLDARSKRTQEGVASPAEREFIKDSRPFTDEQYHTPEERRVITEIETPAARKLGEGTRTDHKGTAYRVAGPTSRTEVPENNNNKKKKR